MANAGPVVFKVLGGSQPPAGSIRFDDDGRVQAIRQVENADAMARFAATEQSRRDFMAGEKPALDAILAGKIAVQGSMAFAVSFRTEFDNLALAVRAKEIGALHHGRRDRDGRIRLRSD